MLTSLLMLNLGLGHESQTEIWQNRIPKICLSRDGSFESDNFVQGPFGAPKNNYKKLNVWTLKQKLQKEVVCYDNVTKM